MSYKPLSARIREPNPAARPYEGQEANLHARWSYSVRGRPGSRTPPGHRPSRVAIGCSRQRCSPSSVCCVPLPGLEPGLDASSTRFLYHWDRAVRRAGESNSSERSGS